MAASNRTFKAKEFAPEPPGRISFLARLGNGDPRVGVGLVAVLAVTAIAYFRALGNEFVGDDWDLIVNNGYLGNWSFIWTSMVNDVLWFHDPRHTPYSLYYRPMHDIWLAINFHLFKFNPIGWHAATVALYLIVVWLVFRVAARISGDNWTGLLAAALFGLMPIHAQAVAWPAAVCQPLVAAFELGAFELYLRWNGESHRTRDLAISLGLYAAALLTYESAVVFPLLIGVYAALFRSAPATRANSPTERAGDALGAMWPYALAVVGYLALRLWVLGFVSEPYRGYHLSAGQALLTIPSAVATYLLLLVMPWRAGPAHRLDPVGSFATLGFIVPVAAFVALCGAGFIALRNNPRRRIYLFGAAWIPIALAPMLNLNGLLAQAVVQDRYLYLPSFGFCLIVADFAVAYARSNETSAQAVWIGAGVLLAALAVILFRTEAFWHDDVAMFSDFVTKFPNVDAWHYQLGKALATRGDFARARGEIETAVNLAPNASAAVLHDLATVDAWLGDRGAAMRAMDTALKRDPNPSADAYAEFALAADAAGDSNASDAALRRAGEIPGGDEIAALTRAQIRFRHGDRAGAESDLKSVFVRDPDNERALVTLGAVLSSEHRYDEALAIYQRAARLPVYDPSLHYLTALVLHHLGRDGESRSECAAALEAAPDDAAANRLMSELEGGAAPR